MENLLNETLEVLAEYKHTPDDIKWCGVDSKWFTWDEFNNIANFEYNEGYGIQEIKHDLVVIGSDWWLERDEHGGAEGWEHKSLPKQPKVHEVPDNLKSIE